MADLSDVRDALAALATTACYPIGTGSPSVTTRQIAIGGGWPEPKDVDAAMTASTSIVSVYAMPGSAAKAEQVFEPPYVITPAAHGMTVSVSGLVVTVTGNPFATEFLTAIVNGRAYSVIAGAGDTNTTMVSALRGQIAADFPGATVSGGAITLPASVYALIARVGGYGTVGQLLHRQRQQFRLTVFAPTEADRKTISAAIDVLFKQTLRLSFTDGSQGIMTYANVIEDDTSERFGNFRRALVYDVCYGTLNTWQAAEITAEGTYFTDVSNIGDPISWGSSPGPSPGVSGNQIFIDP